MNILITGGSRGIGAAAVKLFAARGDRPEDVAQAMAYLIDAPFVTGQVLGVNGGFVIT